MNNIKRVVISLSIALLFFFISMGINLIPCKVAPVVPNPTYQWTFCSLNPDSACTIGATKLFFGYTQSLTEAYIISIILVFLIIFTALYLTRKRVAN